MASRRVRARKSEAPRIPRKHKAQQLTGAVHRTRPCSEACGPGAGCHGRSTSDMGQAWELEQDGTTHHLRLGSMHRELVIRMRAHRAAPLALSTVKGDSARSGKHRGARRWSLKVLVQLYM